VQQSRRDRDFPDVVKPAHFSDSLGIGTAQTHCDRNTFRIAADRKTMLIRRFVMFAHGAEQPVTPDANNSTHLRTVRRVLR